VALEKLNPVQSDDDFVGPLPPPNPFKIGSSSLYISYVDPNGEDILVDVIVGYTAVVPPVVLVAYIPIANLLVMKLDINPLFSVKNVPLTWKSSLAPPLSH
jgi:hypothetical protein